jgi:spectinomycin phosphotransferase
MREPPSFLSDAAVLAAVRTHWDPHVVEVTHLPLGFGAHHWTARVDGSPSLFVTFDALAPRHSADSLEATYAAAGALADGGLDFVLAPLPAGTGSRTVPLADGALSVTPWREGSSGGGPLRDRAEAEATASMIDRLHAVPSPPGLRDWEPVVGRRFAADLALALGRPWETGPYGERARQCLAERLPDIGRWVASYHRLVRAAADRPWVPTHGEPHSANQLVTASRRYLVDWESLRRAPAERDWRTLVQDGYGDLCRPDWQMVEMFDLEWRLDEIASYSRWFSAPHSGSASDEIAYGGLRGELERADWEPAGM